MTSKSVLMLLALLSFEATCFSQAPRDDVSGTHLLKTAWGGAAPLNMFAPGGSTLGCHSNAFAQVMYFHRLAPHGSVSYKCTNGTVISEEFTGYTPQWDSFALDKESAKKDEAATKRTAQFMYYVASIVRKDFGTDQYVDYPNDFHKQAIESHFHCILTGYAKSIKSSMADAFVEEPNFYGLLKSEIDAKRPVGFYYTDRKGGGHAVVIDGYASKNGRLYFHVNFGWFGRSNGWYLLEEDLPPKTKEISLITIVPKNIEKNKDGNKEEECTH